MWRVPEFLFCLNFLLTIALANLRSDHQSQEHLAYCQSEYFRVKCDPDEVILMTHARYGRMRISKCVKENFGYVGCSVNVLDIVDSHCSGRRSCSVRVLDDNFENMKPCHDDLKSYLEVNFKCVKVIVPDRQLCQSMKPVVVTSQTGYLASVTSADTGCGTHESPWLIQLLPGQRVNVTLLDFSITTTNVSGSSGSSSSNSASLAAAAGAGSLLSIDTSSTGAAGAGGGGGGGSLASADGLSKMCRVYAMIRESNGARTVNVCGGETRHKTAYVALDNMVEIRLIIGKTVQNSVNFLLHYEAIGCADLQAPPGGWIKRGDNVAMFGCSDNSETWQLQCKGISWVGDRKNCSRAERIVKGSTDLATSLSLPLGFSLVIIVTLALAVGLLILAVGIICLKRIRDDRRGDSYDQTTCFTLNSSSGRYARGVDHHMEDVKTILRTHVPESYNSSSHPIALVQRVRSYGGPRPNTYACMKLLGDGGSSDVHEDSALATSLPHDDNVIVVAGSDVNNQIACGGSDNEETPKNRTNDLIDSTTMHCPNHESGIRHHTISGSGGDFRSRLSSAIGNERSDIYCSRDTGTVLYACSKHRTINAAPIVAIDDHVIYGTPRDSNYMKMAAEASDNLSQRM